jgi:hypothetical protein
VSLLAATAVPATQSAATPAKTAVRNFRINRPFIKDDPGPKIYSAKLNAG